MGVLWAMRGCCCGMGDRGCCGFGMGAGNGGCCGCGWGGNASVGWWGATVVVRGTGMWVIFKLCEFRVTVSACMHLHPGCGEFPCRCFTPMLPHHFIQCFLANLGVPPGEDLYRLPNVILRGVAVDCDAVRITMRSFATMGLPLSNFAENFRWITRRY